MDGKSVMRRIVVPVLDLALAVTAVAQNYTIQTFAGGALPENMPGVSASLGAVSGVAIDGAGNVLIGLSDYNMVVRLDKASGKLTRVAGNGVKGYAGDNGPATQAELSGPAGIAIDAAGNLYIADFNNARVRMVSNGIISTVAGSGVSGYAGDGGPATGAQLNGPNDIAVDKAGNLYVADFYNQAIRQVANGTITTFAGNGGFGYAGDGGHATDALLGGPAGIALDPGGNLFIAEAYNSTVRRVTNGIITTVAGRGVAGFGGDNGPATRASLNEPTGVTVSASGNLYIADYGNHRIRMVPAAGGNITTVAGNGTVSFSGDNLPVDRAGLGTPQRVVTDSDGNLYLTDTGRIRKVARSLFATSISTIAGGGSPAGEDGPALGAQLVVPQGLALDAGDNLYVSDMSSGRVLKVANGSISRVAAAAQLGSPTGLAVDKSGNLFIADNLNGRIQKVSGTSVSTVGGSPGLSAPQGLAVDAGGNLYVADLNRIRMVAKGAMSTFAGNGSDGYQGDNGPATAAYLASPNGVATDRAGNVFIADTVNNRVRKVANGTITTVAGNGVNDFTGTSVGMPAGVAADASGNLYITDAHRILKLAGGKLTAIGGLPGAQGIAVDGTGKVYVADPSSHSVRVFSPAGTACAMKVSAPEVGSAAGGAVSLSIQTQPDCAWVAESLPAWIGVSGDFYGAGPAGLNLMLASNPDAPRSATIVVGGQSVIIGQAGTMTIVGQITAAGTPLEGVSVMLDGTQSATTATDSGGYFWFDSLDSSASYTVKPALDGYTFTPSSQTFTNVIANPTANFTAKAQ